MVLPKGFSIFLLGCVGTCFGPVVATTLDNDSVERQRDRGSRGAGAKFLSQVVPMTMDGGKSYPVVIQFRNTGGGSWSRANGQHLLVRSTNGARTWGVGKVELDAGRAVPAEGSVTFRFDVTAPAQGGTHDFQWQVAGSGGDLIGDPTPLLKIAVNPSHARGNANAEFVSQNIPNLSPSAPRYAILERGKPYKISLVYKNNGTTPWNAPTFRLNSQNPAQNITWTLDHIDLADQENVKVGQFKSFSFTIIAPNEPGIYPLQWQMFREGAGFFGEPSESVAVTVR